VEVRKPVAVSLPNPLHPEQRLNLAQVETLTGKKKTKIYDGIKAGTFPAPERDGRRCTRWRAGTVLDHLNQKRPAAEAA
jgi:prophage regulatory protein